MDKSNFRLMGIPIDTTSKQGILEKIKLYINRPGQMFHIVSLNPENIVVAGGDMVFHDILVNAQLRINDGTGVVWAARLHRVQGATRLTGVELMKELLKLGKEKSLRTMLIGGKANLALRLAQCYNQGQPEANFVGLEGIKNIAEPEAEEEKQLFDIVTAVAPQIVLVAFGSPWQEKWIWRHREQFRGAVCMGVGQGFDVIGGEVRYAPAWVRRIGLEWLFRLLNQPWRWKRQLRLVVFLKMVISGLLFPNKEKAAY